MGDDVDTLLHLGLLHELAVGAHAVLGEGLGELVRDKRGGVQAGQGDELPRVAELAETLDVGLLLVAGHGLLPVEGGGQVVGEFLLGPHGVHAVGEFLGLLVVGQLALHPDEIGEGRVGDGAVDGALGAALVAVEALAGAGGIPVPEDVDAGEVLGDGAGFVVALALGGSEVLVDEALLVGVGAGVDGVDDGFVEELEAGLGGPFVLDGLQLGTVLASLLGGNHQVVEILDGGVCGAHDEGVVAVIDGGGEEGGGLGVGTGDGEEVGAHDIGLGADGNQTVDVLADGNEDLAGHVATLLCAGGLIFDVNTGSTTLNEELGQLHDGGQTTVTSVGIGDNGAQVVNVGDGSTLGCGGSNTLLTLFPVVEELCQEQLVNLAGHGVL